MTIQIEIPEGKEAKWVDNVLTLVDKQQPLFKYNIGDALCFKGGKKKLTVVRRKSLAGKPYYDLEGDDGCMHPDYSESDLEPYIEPKDITKHIKTFEDACEWCCENHNRGLYLQYSDALNVGLQRAKDILAYLKLRIITCALNEGWEPTFEKGEQRWTVSKRFEEEELLNGYHDSFYAYIIPASLYFKSEKLAEYAATQFKDIYMDFCYKGKE